jgi:hypothetical protein
MRKSKQRKQTRRKDTKAMLSRKNMINKARKLANAKARQEQLDKDKEAVNINA